MRNMEERNKEILKVLKEVADLCSNHLSCRECFFFVNENYQCSIKNTPHRWDIPGLEKEIEERESTSKGV